VLFAAHCVNDLPDTAYDGENFRAAVGFDVDAFPGLLNWFGTGQSNPLLKVFNINRIFYDERSLQNPQAQGFIEADIALASLDTPAAGIPMWAMLFSTLPAPEAIDPVTGTGYHVNIVGYGGTGNAIQGAVEGIDFRRRAAENMLGGFMSLDDRNAVLFGPGRRSCRRTSISSTSTPRNAISFRTSTLSATTRYPMKASPLAGIRVAR
jgi:hypothetical protein